MRTLMWAPKVVEAKLRAMADVLNHGYLDIYDDDNIRLVHLPFAADAFHLPKHGEMVSYALEAFAEQAGIASWFRCVTGDGQAVVEGSVGTTQADVVLSSTVIHHGARVTIESFTLTE